MTNGWYLIASPLDKAFVPSTENGFLNNTYDLYRFNQSAELEWENWKSHVDNDDHYHFDLEPGKGYLYANSGNVTLMFCGTPYSGNGTVNLEYSTVNQNENMHGMNLIGNPFATAATIDKPFFRMNEGGTALTAQVEAGNTVAAMEGVFVQATQEGQTALFTQVNNRGGEKSEVPMINVNLIRNRGEVLSNAIVRFDNGETLGAFSLREDDSKLYIPQNGKDYAIACVGRDSVHTVSTAEIPVNFKAMQNSEYTITVNPENLEMNYLHLIDNLTGADLDVLASPNYTFFAKSTDYTSRFKLVFMANNANLDGKKNDDFAFTINGHLIVTGEGTLQIVDMMGRVLVSKQLSTTNSQLPTADFRLGVYVLRLINGEEVKTQKIVVK